MFFLFLTHTHTHTHTHKCIVGVHWKNQCVCSAHYVVAAQRGETGAVSVSLFICLSMRGTDGPFSAYPGTRYWLSFCYKKDIITYETLKETRHGGSAICYPVNVSISQLRCEFVACISKLTWRTHYILSQRGNKTSVNRCFLAMTSSKVMFTFLLCNRTIVRYTHREIFSEYILINSTLLPLTQENGVNQLQLNVNLM